MSPSGSDPEPDNGTALPARMTMLPDRDVMAAIGAWFEPAPAWNTFSSAIAEPFSAFISDSARNRTYRPAFCGKVTSRGALLLVSGKAPTATAVPQLLPSALT